jgi:hypothetical protein
VLKVKIIRTSNDKTALLGALSFTNAVNSFSIPVDTEAEYTKPADQALAHNLTLDALIQELSLNLTLSFFGDSQFWVLLENDYNKTIHTYINIKNYSYSTRYFLLAYAISFAASLYAIIVGAWAFVTNGASYSFSSTIFQSTRKRTSDELVLDDEETGSKTLSLSMRLGRKELRLSVKVPFSSATPPKGSEFDMGQVGANRRRHVTSGLSEELENFYAG